MTPLAALALAVLITFHHAAAIPAVLGAVVAWRMGGRHMARVSGVHMIRGGSRRVRTGRL